MSTALAALQPLAVDGVRIAVSGDRVLIVGVISMRDPSEAVTPFLRRLHRAAVLDGRSELLVDLTDLRFMNSSSIRALIDWVEWIRQEPDDKKYVLRFIPNPEVTWQKTTLSAIQALSKDVAVTWPGA